MSTKLTTPNSQTGKRKRLFQSLSISAFVALSLTMSAAQQSAQAEQPPASIETITSLKGPSDALESGVKGFALPAFFCTYQERKTKDEHLQNFKDLNEKWLKQIEGMTNWARSQRGRPVAAYYEREIRQVTLLNATLKRIARAIEVKRKQLWQVPIKDCTNTATDINMTTPEAPTEPVDPLDGITFWQPRYYDVSAPAAPGRLCKEIDKLDYIVAVAEARGNAGFNMNQADGVISDIEEHLTKAQSAVTRSALEAMLVSAKANLHKRIAELDAFDKLYAEAQKLKVEDCFANDTEAAMADPLDDSQFNDLGVEVHLPDLKEVTLIELPAFVCDEDERGRLMARATVQSSKALKNVYEWQKRRDSIAEALRQGKGNGSLLRQARYETDIEIGKREIIHQQTQEIFDTAQNLPIVDCSPESSDHTSMGLVSTPNTKDQDALLAAINDLLFIPSPYTSDGEIVLPYPTEPEDALIYEAEDAVHDRQRDVHRHEQWQRRKDAERAAHETNHTQSGRTAATDAKKSEGSKGTRVGTKRPWTLGFPLKTGPQLETESSQPEVVHEDLDHRTGAREVSSPRTVYPPTKTTNPEIKAPSEYEKEPMGLPKANQTEPQETGQWVQVKPPVLVIPVEAAGAQ